MKRWELHRVFFFHLYKEHSIKFFFIWTGGVEQVCLFFSSFLFYTKYLLDTLYGSWPIIFPFLLLPPYSSPTVYIQCLHTLTPHRFMETPPCCSWRCSLSKELHSGLAGDARVMLPEASEASISWATCLAASKMPHAVKVAFKVVICE